jgi:hypothetical protein
MRRRRRIVQIGVPAPNAVLLLRDVGELRGDN